MNNTVKCSAMALAVAMLSASGLVAVAQAQQTVSQNYTIEEDFSGTRLSFSADSALSNFTLNVSGPDDYYGQIFSARVVPSFRLADHGSVPDGIYRYQITAATPERVRRASPRPDGADGREPGAGPGFVGMSQSGSFRVVNGRILELDPTVEEG
jgi:hypothetical protein